MTDADYITTTDAAREMRVSRARVTLLCRTGRLEGARRHGRDWLVPRSTAQAWTPRASGYHGHATRAQDA